MSLEIWNITPVSVTATVQCSTTTSNLSNLLCPIQPRKPDVTLWNRQYRNGHNWDELTDLGSISTKFWFFMATSRYEYAIANPNFVGIGSHLAMLVRVYQLCYVRCSESLLTWAIRAESSVYVYDNCAVTATWTCVIFNIFEDKYTCLITDSINCRNFISLHYDRLISTMGFPILVKRYISIESGPYHVAFWSRLSSIVFIVVDSLYPRL